MLDTLLEGDHPRIISAKFGWDWLSSFRGEDFFLNFITPFSILSLTDFLVVSRDHRTLFWKGTIQGPFHQSLVAIGPRGFWEEDLYVNFPLGSMLSLVRLWDPSWSKGCTGSIRTKFWWNSHWMVLFQKYVRRFGPSTKMAPQSNLA
jgi:hypothetical protein